MPLEKTKTTLRGLVVGLLGGVGLGWLFSTTKGREKSKEILDDLANGAKKIDDRLGPAERSLRSLKEHLQRKLGLRE